MYTYAHIHKHVYIYIYIYIYIYSERDIDIHICTYRYIHIHVNRYMCVYIYMYMHDIYVYIDIHIHIYIHISLAGPRSQIPANNDLPLTFGSEAIRDFATVLLEGQAHPMVASHDSSCMGDATVDDIHPACPDIRRSYRNYGSTVCVDVYTDWAMQDFYHQQYGI